MGITDEKTMALTTYRRNGEPVVTPVWVNQVSDGRIGFWTAMGSGKTKRLKRDPHVTVQACSTTGKIKPGAPLLNGTAEMIQSGPPLRRGAGQGQGEVRRDGADQPHGRSAVHAQEGPALRRHGGARAP